MSSHLTVAFTNTDTTSTVITLCRLDDDFWTLFIELHFSPQGYHTIVLFVFELPSLSPTTYTLFMHKVSQIYPLVLCNSRSPPYISRDVIRRGYKF